MASALTRQLRVSIDTLSPLHVGDGRGQLVEDVDYVKGRDGVYLIDPARLWKHLGDEQLAHWNTSELRLSDVLRPSDYAACASAVITRVGHLESGTGLINQIADSRGRPYLPGSSLKGALRTALLRATGGPFNLGTVGPSRSWAGQTIERSYFGRDPNSDLLRTLHVADSEPLDPAQLQVVVVATYSLRGGRLQPKGQGYRLNVVAIPAGTRLETTLGLDTWTLSQDRLGFGARATWPDELAARCNRASRALIDAERQFYAEVHQPALERFYADLSRSRVLASDHAFLLPVGWGTGWLAKTIGPDLRGLDGFEETRTRFSLGQPGAPFPKSRRLVETAPDRPIVPLGWTRITLEEVA